MAEEAVASVGTRESALVAVGVWVLSAVRAVVAEEAVASVGRRESALGASLAAVEVWVLSAVLSAARVSVVAELDRSEPAVSPGGPLRRHGQASQRRASLAFTLQARA